MRDEKDALDGEKKKLLDEKERLLAEKERYLTDRGGLKEDLDEEKARLRAELDAVTGGLDQKIDERLAEQEAARAEARIAAGGPTVQLPSPVHSEIAYSRSVDGDEEYWLQNVTPCNENVSDVSRPREREASVVEFMQKDDAKKSYVGSVREMEEDQEMRANIS